MNDLARRRWSSRGLLLLVLVVLWAPLVPLLVRAFAVSWRFPEALPAKLSMRGIHNVVGPGGEVLHGLVLSLGIGVAVAFLACLVGWPAGRALGLHRFRGRRAVQVLLLTPVIVPTLAAAMGLQVLFIRIGVAGTAVGVVLVQLIPAVPYATSVLAAGFANLDADYETQARALGAGPVRRTWSVTVPLLRAPLVAAAVLAFLISWSDYLLAFLVGSGRVQTLPVQLFAAVNATDATTAAAVSLAVILPPLVLVTLAAGPLARVSAANLGRGPR